ncbi:helix-turn-helix domain-containing protein [Mangrovivirga cuniculi]|uniref:HTH cro/C1-type domain-containing protein n=1 Tax=Mangrovivirga cuniculi TaxID=2715131 RepID=A0A4D7JHW4_9BACT|nr:helix-turn-helix transcriptional regulator [Mangrovivirga cuniculi]QCK15221.1 hypothetical protein DCC35_10925 [Mangrovivirga cuniculi]
MEIGEKIRYLRISKGFTKSDLARKAKISNAQLGRYEEGTSQPTASFIVNLADALDCTPNYLLNIKENRICHVDNEYFNRFVENFHSLNLDDKLDILNILKKYYPVSS